MPRGAASLSPYTLPNLQKWAEFAFIWQRLIQAVIRCLKRLSERVTGRDFDRHVAELQIKATILNRFAALGTPDVNQRRILNR